MSINSAMLAGVTGLISNASRLAAISDNIANANTVGYKRVGVDFSTLVNNGATNDYSAGGVASVASQFVTQQGTLTGTTSATDLAVSGDGFFVTTDKATGVTASDPRYFTRAGSFSIDTNGYLKNTAGLYLQGWAADANGNVTTDSSNLSSLGPINLNDIASTAAATTTSAASGNLNSDQTINSASYAAGDMAAYAANPANGVKPDFSIQMPIADSKGGQRNVVIDFLKTSTPNVWNMEVRADPPTDVSTTDGLVGAGSVTFDTSGKLLSQSMNSITPSWNASLGVASQAISLDLSGMTQFSAASAVSSVKTNGTAFGSLAGVSIDSNGYVTATFGNGTTRRVAQVAVATFPNENGLKAVNGNAYQASASSGGFTLKTAGSGGAGKISPSSLEASTVDLSSEFTGLITTQRAYSASSKIITTADQMLQDLIDIKR